MKFNSIWVREIKFLYFMSQAYLGIFLTLTINFFKKI